MWGRWAGRGRVPPASCTRQKRPSKLTRSPVQTAFIRRSASSVRAARSAKGTPSAANSSRHQPTPAPRMIRPPERWSAVASALAVAIGFR